MWNEPRMCLGNDSRITRGSYDVFNVDQTKLLRNRRDRSIDWPSPSDWRVYRSGGTGRIRYPNPVRFRETYSTGDNTTDRLYTTKIHRSRFDFQAPYKHTYYDENYKKTKNKNIGKF